MNITSFQIYPKQMQLSEPYQISTGHFSYAENVFIRLETDVGLVAYGCAAPAPEINGETASAAATALESIAKPILKDLDPLRPRLVNEMLREQILNFPAARAAVDMALLDLMGKHAGVPVWKLLGGYRDNILTSITLGIDSTRRSVKRAKVYVARGFVALKIKGGISVEADIKRVTAVRRAVGDRIALRFDANGGYSLDEAIHFVSQTRALGLELIEQPVGPKNLGAITGATRTPIMADEGMRCLADVFRLARDELVDMVNIKLMKVGGIAEATQIDAVARAAGLETMVGCMDESAISIAAALHFALASPNVNYADLDGHLDLQDDPFNGVVTIKNGRLIPSPLNGLGADSVALYTPH